MSEDLQLSPLGILLETARLGTGQPTDAFLAERGLAFHTWRRMLYGLPAPGGGRPRNATVLRYARAAGVDEAQALKLADKTFAETAPPREMSQLGAALERGRLATGMETRPFLHKHGLSITTWYRLLHGEEPRPKRLTVVRYARAAGVDLDMAQALAAQDRRSLSPCRPPDTQVPRQ
jgi:hypothetical protein